MGRIVVENELVLAHVGDGDQKIDPFVEEEVVPVFRLDGDLDLCRGERARRPGSDHAQEGEGSSEKSHT